jgi:PhzF family phenazine biosynthesis protein
MDVLHIAAFSTKGQGGNPAGVVLGDELPNAEIMQAVAADVGYSETVFAAKIGAKFRVRYFAPQAEVPFCGHATIALGAALGASFGAGSYRLLLNEAEITVEAKKSGDGWAATLQSPNTQHRAAEPELIRDTLALFGLTQDELESHREIVRANAGAEHMIIPLASHQLLRDMDYDFESGAALMQAHGLVTINLIWRESSTTIHSRNPFAGHGVYEDPATGAAAAALGGYLRDAGLSTTPFEVHQGVDMGVPSRLWVEPLNAIGGPVMVGGDTRNIRA